MMLMLSKLRNLMRTWLNRYRFSPNSLERCSEDGTNVEDIGITMCLLIKIARVPIVTRTWSLLDYLKKKTEYLKGFGSSQESEDKKIRCTECEGYGHYQAEWPNFLKRKNKSYSATLCDADEDVESSNDSDEEIRALMGCLSPISSQVTFPSDIVTDVAFERTREVKSDHHQLPLEEVY